MGRCTEASPRLCVPVPRQTKDTCVAVISARTSLVLFNAVMRLKTDGGGGVVNDPLKCQT